MIQYSLICENSHEFEAWFKSSIAYDEQQRLGIVTCPICAGSKISKALMAPSLGAKSNRGGPTQSGAASADEQSGGPAASSTEKQSLSLSSGHPDQAKLQKVMHTLRDKITSQADYVGKNFASEARKIHEGENEARSIYGEATVDETVSLLEEGVDIMPLPTLPEEQN